MKTLQNNFTTPEQSKRLLDLGVPADSADCVFMRGYSSYGKDEFVVPFYKTDSIVSFFKDHEWEDGIDFIHCWSAGRLIEIYNLCAHGFYTLTKVPKNLIEHIISRYGWEIRYAGMDFSKLEE